MADSIVSALVEQIETVVDEKVRKSIESASNERTVAKVVEKDSEGTIWVHLEGGLPTTPVAGSYASVVPGQTVNVVNIGGKLYIDGNYSSPTIGAVEYQVVQKDLADANTIAEEALSAADVADKAAANAIESSRQASEAASNAEASAAEASTAAATADGKATAAAASAETANSYAIGALSSLSDVEKVVGTLNWIAEHGTYSPTTDNVVQPSKSYYTFDGTDYAPVENPTDEGLYRYELTLDEAIDPEKTYYEQVVDVAYEKTADTEVDPNKTYYIMNPDTGEYEEVDDPDDADIGTYYELVERVAYEPVEEPDIDDLPTYYERHVAYYELGIDVSVQNYIASHLALTDEGLNLTGDASMYRAILGVDGLRIIDPLGRVVGLHGESIQLGAMDGVYFEATSNILAFRTADQQIAWFGQNSDGIWEMHISTTYAEDMIRFGDYAWIRRQNGNMTIKWVGEVSS